MSELYWLQVFALTLLFLLGIAGPLLLGLVLYIKEGAFEFLDGSAQEDGSQLRRTLCRYARWLRRGMLLVALVFFTSIVLSFGEKQS